jgi:hypothetical protein
MTKLERDAAIADRMFAWGRAMQDTNQFPLMIIADDTEQRELAIHFDDRMPLDVIVQILTKSLRLIQAGKTEHRHG